MLIANLLRDTVQRQRAKLSQEDALAQLLGVRASDALSQRALAVHAPPMDFGAAIKLFNDAGAIEPVRVNGAVVALIIETCNASAGVCICAMCCNTCGLEFGGPRASVFVDMVCTCIISVEFLLCYYYLFSSPYSFMLVLYFPFCFFCLLLLFIWVFVFISFSFLFSLFFLFFVFLSFFFLFFFLFSFFFFFVILISFAF